MKNETPNIDTAKLIHAIRELARVQRATAHVVARVIHRSPECDELASFTSTTLDAALAALGAE